MKERIETVIDRLLEYVRLNGRTSLSQAASALGLQAEQAERLALLLEEHGLIEVRYGVLGITLYDRGILAQKKAEPGAKSLAVQQAQELEAEILKTENMVQFFEKDLERRILRAEGILVELEKKDNLSRRELDVVRKEVDAALGQLAAFSSEVQELSEKEQRFYRKLTTFRQKIERLKAQEEMQTPRPWWAALLDALRHGLQKPKAVPPAPERRKAEVPAVTFEPEEKSRVLRRRKDNVKEHYWVKRKRQKKA